jgi:hypothetical protein
MIRARRRRLLLSLLPVAVLLAGLELGALLLERLRPPLVVDVGWGFDERSRVFRSLGSGERVTDPAKRLSFQHQVFDPVKPAGVRRVVMLGGSNVFNLDLNRLEAGLDARLSSGRVELLNLGGNAYGSQRLLFVAAEMLDYDPDLLLIYSGHNEFEELETWNEVRLGHAPLERVLYRSALLRAIRDGVLRGRIERAAATRRARWLSQPPGWAEAAAHSFEPAEIAERMEAFHDNLDHIIRAYRSRGVPVIIGTVATNLWNPDLPPELAQEKEHLRALYSAGRYPEGMALAERLLGSAQRHQASGVENGIIRSLARQHGLVLVDVAAAIAAAEPHGVPGETLLDDRCHLQDEGQRILLELYEDEALEALEASSP